MVGHARSGKKALEMYDREKPDIVISDIKMQGMDGLELAQRLKEKAPGVIVILLSAYKDFEYAQKGFEYGVSNYLLKHELCEEKLLYELEKVKKKLSENEQRKKIYYKYFTKQLIYNQAEDMELPELGNRNIRRFIELCKKHGMYVIVRIGPFDHGEVRNGGIPDWLYGKPFEVRSLNEGWLSYTRKLYREFAKQFDGLHFKDGGPIIGTQIENEYMHSASPWEMTTGISDEWRREDVTVRNICGRLKKTPRRKASLRPSIPAQAGAERQRHCVCT